MNASRQRPFWSHNPTPVSWTQGRTALLEMPQSLPGLPGCLSVHIDMASSRGHLSSQLGVLGQRQAEARTLDLALPLFLVRPHTFLCYALCKIE